MAGDRGLGMRSCGPGFLTGEGSSLLEGLQDVKAEHFTEANGVPLVFVVGDRKRRDRRVELSADYGLAPTKNCSCRRPCLAR
jgi:hypothetical protein